MWVRGLKLLCLPYSLHAAAVAPYVGAWIETFMQDSLVNAQRVAPYVGAWIETKPSNSDIPMKRSHPMWVRGLKRGVLTLFEIRLCRTLCGCVD